MQEPKTEAYWRERGYRFFELSSCPACGDPISVWESPSAHMIFLEAQTLETHFSSCTRAREYRTEQRMKAGVL
ncbi:MAG TPA: hypothetical protein VGQ12_07435 [Candidatus Angelobacter sp.]|jgi:hypothetical protein|nr:hypothetical protein [Candidatus Angelobacter sp.]